MVNLGLALDISRGLESRCITEAPPSMLISMDCINLYPGTFIHVIESDLQGNVNQRNEAIDGFVRLFPLLQFDNERHLGSCCTIFIILQIDQ